MIIAVVIPCFKVKKHILEVISGIGAEVTLIYIIDDCCPEKSGEFVASHCSDKRVKVLYHPQNKGVGGATITGYRQALSDGADVIVKIDGDGQMEAGLIPVVIRPIVEGGADYTKGNRFYNLEGLPQMPRVRLFGNAVLSFFAKFSTGYWDLFDPTNGYTAIHTRVAAKLPLDKIENRYFFESDILFRLNTLRAVVVDIPMDARYGDEESSLRVLKVIPEFFFKHVRNAVKRIFYNYYLRDFSIASLEIVVGLMSLAFGIVFGSYAWFESARSGLVASSGTVMLAALPTILGVQLILGFLSADAANVPKTPVQKRI